MASDQLQDLAPSKATAVPFHTLTCLINLLNLHSHALSLIPDMSGPALQAVESPALAIMVPLLIRGLRHKDTPIMRKTSIIIANMSKLVNNPADATVFLPRLLPGVKVGGHANITLCFCPCLKRISKKRFPCGLSPGPWPAKWLEWVI